MTWAWQATEHRVIERAKRARKSGFTAVYDGHARVTLPVTQHARARVAHGAACF